VRAAVTDTVHTYFKLENGRFYSSPTSADGTWTLAPGGVPTESFGVG